MGLVRVGAGVGQPVPVRWPTAEVAALLAGLGGHRGADPDPGPGYLPLGLDPQRQHRSLLPLAGEVDRPAGLRHPQLDAVVLEQRSHQRILAAVKRPLILLLPDHDRVKAPVGVGHRREQRGGLRAARPRQHPALPGIEELRRDLTVPGHQPLRLVQLPRP